MVACYDKRFSCGKKMVSCEKTFHWTCTLHTHISSKKRGDINLIQCMSSWHKLANLYNYYISVDRHGSVTISLIQYRPIYNWHWCDLATQCYDVVWPSVWWLTIFMKQKWLEGLKSKILWLHSPPRGVNIWCFRPGFHLNWVYLDPYRRL